MSSITMRTGSEGPRHDPYSYTELTVRRGNTTVSAHYGLLVWLECNGEREQINDDKLLSMLFQDMTGLTIKQAERAYAKLQALPYREHRKHGGYDWREGFPGESLCMCKCGKVIDYSFNESAII